MLYTAEQTAQLPAEGFRYLLAEQSDHVLTITLNRPEKKNALNPPLLAELAFALAYAHFTPDVWLVVLAASGDVFCAGMDLKSLSSGDVEPLSVPEPAGPVRLGELLAGLHKPCICRVQGPVYAGGFLLVGGSTYVVASEAATFTLPEVKRGLFPFQGAGRSAEYHALSSGNGPLSPRQNHHRYRCADHWFSNRRSSCR